MMRMRMTLMTVVVAMACVAAPASAGLKLDAWRGHLAFGFARVVSDSLAPVGSLSAGAGVDYPLGRSWRVGPSFNYSLLGSSPVTRGSISASLDYSVFEAAMLFTYLTSRGPVTRLAIGPGVASARAELVVSSGGAGFTDLAVAEIQPELALEATLGSRRMPTVSVGAELGARIVPVSQGTWTMFSARLAVHY